MLKFVHEPQTKYYYTILKDDIRERVQLMLLLFPKSDKLELSTGKTGDLDKLEQEEET